MSKPTTYHCRFRRKWRCGYFFTNLLLDVESLKSGTLRTVLQIDAPMAWVAPRDIAEVAA